MGPGAGARPGRASRAALAPTHAHTRAHTQERVYEHRSERLGGMGGLGDGKQTNLG